MKRINNFIIILIVFGFSCSNNNNITKLDEYPAIYPDYTDIHIPYNIAPLNFMIKENCTELNIEVSGKYGEIKTSGKAKVLFPLNKFKDLLFKHKNDTLSVKVTAKINNKIIQYKSFRWFVHEEPIDSYLTYRLIEPGYEVWNKINISERNTTNFDDKVLADNNLIEGSCMNCHIGSKQNPSKSFFHIRGPNGGTIVAEGEKLRKLNTKPVGSYANAIYGNWHPSGNYIGFSTNIVLPATHTIHDKRVLVYDTKSDIIVVDLNKNEIISSPLVSRNDKFETFPEFSADGRKLIFCVSDSVKLPEDYKSLHYNLCSIDFNEKDRTFGKQVDTLINARVKKKTVSEPKASPDGKYILFTWFNYGTFPIWHREAKLCTYNLHDGSIDSLPEVNNNNYSNSYHSWSSNSRWFVFASKRDDGLYGKPYFSYFDKNGKAHKPFLLPQKDPEFYDFTYKSFNIPELFEQARAFDAMDIERIYNDTLSVVKLKKMEE
ncbi:MAG: hypothetical protein U0W24_16305 [Bacteroidales bacterium]